MGNIKTMLTALVAASACTTVVEGKIHPLALTQDVIAKTLYSEARSEGPEGIRMVATVIYNRGKGRYTYCVSECLRKSQFSCWNNKKDIAVNVAIETYNAKARWTDAQAWAYCKLIEDEIKTAKFKPIGSWTYYATVNCRASWIKTMTNVTKFKNHVFGCV